MIAIGCENCAILCNYVCDFVISRKERFIILFSPFDELKANGKKHRAEMAKANAQLPCFITESLELTK